MILVCDVGNTESTIGAFRKEDLAGHWRITTDMDRTPDEWGVLLVALLRERDLQPSEVRGFAIGSVVPPVTAVLEEMSRRWLRLAPVHVDAKSVLPIRLEVDEPHTVGPDRIINTLAACRLYRRDTIVVDLGTATTYDCITGDGVFLGGVIQPGVRSSADSLIRRTSRLPATELIPPKEVIGKRTEECIRAGVLFGATDSIDGIVRRIKRAWPRKDVPFVVATGGLAASLQPHCAEIEEVDPHLTLRGLRIAYDLLSGAEA